MKKLTLRVTAVLMRHYHRLPLVLRRRYERQYIPRASVPVISHDAEHW